MRSANETTVKPIRRENNLSRLDDLIDDGGQRNTSRAHGGNIFYKE